MKKLSFGFKTYLVIAHFYFILANIPLFILVSRTPPGTFFPLYHTEHIADYNVYLSAITQGTDGKSFMEDHFTSEKTNPTVFYAYYIWLGKITAVFNLPPYIIYHLGRAISFELFIIGLYTINKVILGKKNAFWGALIATTATVSPIFLFKETAAGVFDTFTPWWSNLEAINRMDALPHYLFGYSLLFFSILLIFSLWTEFKKSYLLLAIITVFLTGILFPPAGLPIIIGIPIALLIYYFRKYIQDKKMRIPRKRILTLGIIVLTAFIALLIIWRENSNGFPWSYWNQWEKEKWNYDPNFNRNLILSFGILPLISLPAAIYIFRSRSLEEIFVAVWAYLPLILLPIINLIGISKMRLTSMAPFVPFGILSAITIFKLASYLKMDKFRILIFLIFLLTTIPVTFDIYHKSLGKAQNMPLYGNIFIANRQWHAIKFMKEKLPARSIILSNEQIGNFIPAYTTHISFFGHIVHTKNFFDKQKFIYLFLRNNLSKNDARAYIMKNNIQYIYFGPGEKELGSDSPDYDFLKVIYNQDGVSIYRVLII